MGLFDRWKNEANETEQKETIGVNPTMEELRRFFNTDDIANISDSKLTSTSYYACMQIRCNAVAKLPLKIMQETDKGTIKATEHVLYPLLKNRPNPYTNAHDFLWATEFQRLEFGNAYWYMDVKRGKIQGFYLFDSRKMHIYIDDAGILSKKKNAVYYQYDGDKIYHSDSIIHFKNFAMNGIEGTSIKKYLSTVIVSEQYAANVIANKYKNGLQDPIIVEFSGDLDEKKQNKIRDKFQKLGGAKNAGKVIPIPADFKVMQLETKLVNSQFFQMQGLTTRHIANAFGVKSFQLNDMEKSTYNNIEQQNKAFYSDTLQNVLTTYEQELDYKAFRKDEKDAGYYTKFAVDSILRSDLATRYSSYATGISSGFQTIAEVRAKEDLPFVEGTDKLIIGNGASIPLADLGKQYTKGGGEGE